MKRFFSRSSSLALTVREARGDGKLTGERVGGHPDTLKRTVGTPLHVLHEL